MEIGWLRVVAELKKLGFLIQKMETFFLNMSTLANLHVKKFGF